MMNKQNKILWEEMKQVFKHTCVRCEGESGLANVERDHIIPRYQGGNDLPTNWQPLCARCNASKGPETVDHRIKFAEKHGIIIPKHFLLEPKIMITKETQPIHFKMLMILLEEALDVNGCESNFVNLEIAFDELEKDANIIIDRELTTDYFKNNGAYCDCEIMLNIIF